MTVADFETLEDRELLQAVENPGLGLARGLAIEVLAKRALEKPELLDAACGAISSDRRVGYHAGTPLGWLGADCFYLSRQEGAIRRLLTEMNSWDITEQEDLVRHWAGSGGLGALSAELQNRFGWVPKYGHPAAGA